MNILDMYKEDKTLLSFEVFPPKKTSPIESVYGALEELCALKPAYISVTYGAGGTEADNTCAIASKIKHATISKQSLTLPALTALRLR